MSEKKYAGMYASAKPEIFRFAEQLRANMTDEEKKLWKTLRLKPKGFKFRRQHPFGQYILDFYCHKAKLAIEIDGKNHDLPKQKDLDEKITSIIKQWDLTEMRFTNKDVNQHFEKIIAAIYKYLEEYESIK